MNLKRKSPAKTKKYMIAIKTAMDARINEAKQANNLEWQEVKTQAY